MIIWGPAQSVRPYLLAALPDCSGSTLEMAEGSSWIIQVGSMSSQGPSGTSKFSQREVMVNAKGREERKAALLTLKMVEGATSHGMQVLLGAGKPRNRFSPEPPEGA